MMRSSGKVDVFGKPRLNSLVSPETISVAVAVKWRSARPGAVLKVKAARPAASVVTTRSPA